MSTWRGHGGAVTVKNTDTPLGVSKWSCEESVVLANKTNSTSGGHKQRQATVKDTSFSLELPWDDTTDPAAIGIHVGATIKLVLNKGESGKKISFADAIVEKVSWTDGQDEELVQLVLSGYSNSAGVHS